MINTDEASKIKGLAWLLAAVGIGAVFALGISPFVRAIPWSWEKNIADRMGSAAPSNVCTGTPQQQVLLNTLLRRIYPLDHSDTRFSIDVQVVNNPQVNAFAELGGKIYVNKGLLKEAQSPDEIAGVLAHEITHVSRRHVLEGFIVRMMTFGGIHLLLGNSVTSAQWTSFFLGIGFTRGQEAEADEGALVRLRKAHVDNQGLRTFFERLKGMDTVPSFLSDHPASGERADMAQQYQNQGTKPIMPAADWKTLQAYCR